MQTRTAPSLSKLLRDRTFGSPAQVHSETTSLLEYYVIFLHRLHLQAHLYTGELLRRPNMNVQLVSLRTRTGGQTGLTWMFTVATQSRIYKQFSCEFSSSFSIVALGSAFLLNHGSVYTHPSCALMHSLEIQAEVS